MLAIAAMTALLLGASPPAVLAISRAEALSRAKCWTQAKVPYSQSAYTYAPDGLERYRQDCSGFVSMAWRLGTSYNTRTITQTADPITKDRLQAGDMMLRRDATYGHAVFFGGWADTGRNTYYAYEESSRQGGAVTRVTPYPYWNNDTGYKPYRPRSLTTATPSLSAQVDLVAGADRYDTAAQASRRAFPSQAATAVVLCSGEQWPDALGAGALAGALDGVVLLTRRASLPPATANELTRLRTRRVYIAGGTGAVSEDVETALRARGLEVQRVGGADRYETSAMLASATVSCLRATARTFDGRVFVATGGNYPDALVASPLAYRRKWPILLTRRSDLPASVAEAAPRIGVRYVMVLGGTGSVEASVGEALDAAVGGAATVIRIARDDRYQMSAALAEYGLTNDLRWPGAAIASGQSFADALAGGAMQGKLRAPLFLTPAYSLHASPSALVKTNAATIGRVRVLGGDGAVAFAVRCGIARLLGGRP